MSIAEYTGQETDLKQILHFKIDQIQSIDKLRKLDEYAALLANDEIYIHTPEEAAITDETISEMDAGLGIPHAVVNAEIRERFSGVLKMRFLELPKAVVEPFVRLIGGD